MKYHKCEKTGKWEEGRATECEHECVQVNRNAPRVPGAIAHSNLKRRV